MNNMYCKLIELIDNNGGLLNDESLHFIAKHGLLCELLLCDNRLVSFKVNFVCRTRFTPRHRYLKLTIKFIFFRYS